MQAAPFIFHNNADSTNHTDSAMAEIRTAIRDNHTRLYLLLDDIDSITALTRALQGPLGRELSNSGVCSIAFDGENYAAWETEQEDIGLLFEAFATHVEGLTKYEFECFVPEIPSPEHLFPISILTDLLRRLRGRLEILRLNEVVLHATEQEYQEFLEVIRSLKCLRCCFLQDTVSIMVDMQPRTFDETLLAITQLPLIMEVSMETDWCHAAGSCRLATTQPIRSLCTSTTIQCLSFDSMHPYNHAFSTICSTLIHNQILQILHIKFANFSIPSQAQPQQPAHYFDQFANFLQSNVGLKELELEFADLNTDDDNDDATTAPLDPILILLLTGLARNPRSTLETIDIRARCEFGSTIEAALLQLMRTNYVIQSLGIISVDADGQERTYEPRHRTELDLYGRLNSFGRQALMMATATRGQFVEAFATKLSHDLDGLYYYLRIHPWLMCQQGQGQGRQHGQGQAPQPQQTTGPLSRKRRRITDTCTDTTTTTPAHDDNGGGLSYADALLELERLRKENAQLKARLAERGV